MNTDSEEESLRHEALKRVKKLRAEPKPIKRRLKKTKSQLLVLESEFLKNPVWNHEKNVQLALSLNMTLDAVGKWNW